jgi:polyphosphate kinase 2 (PPK2 family)
MHKAVWKNRFKDIRAYERYLTRNGTLVLKFYLHLSKDEQRRRFLERLDNPSKNWKFSFADLAERRRWDDYMVAYEDMIANTSTSKAPWYVVPADNKWFTRMVVVATIVEALENIDLSFPKPRGKARNELAKARKMLTQEG